MSHEWQTDFPILEAQAVTAAILSKTFSMDLIDEGWVIAEYALRQVRKPGARAAMPAPVPDADALQHLHDYAADEAEWEFTEPEHEVGEPVARARAMGFPLPWGQLATLLIDACAAELKKYLAAGGA